MSRMMRARYRWNRVTEVEEIETERVFEIRGETGRVR